MMKELLTAICLLSVGLPAVLLAHVPYFESEVIRDISVSQVHYYEVLSRGVREIKIISSGENLYLMFAVPMIERLRDFRPSFKLVDPEGELLESFSTTGVEPRVYHEEFGDTYEWIYYEREFETRPGTYVLLVESNGPGKFWIAVGRAERFGIIDVLSLPVTLARVRIFHEVFPIVWWGWIAMAVLALGIWGLIALLRSG